MFFEGQLEADSIPRTSILPLRKAAQHSAPYAQGTLDTQHTFDHRLLPAVCYRSCSSRSGYRNPRLLVSLASLADMYH